MLLLSAVIVPCGLLALMLAMQRVQEALLPSAGPGLAPELTAEAVAAASA